MNRRATSVLGLVGLLVTAGLAAGCSSSGAEAVKFTAAPESVSYAAELQVFTDLGSMAATSDLVVRATVTQVAQGRTTGTAEDGGATTSRDVTLRVDQVIYQKRSGQVPGSIILGEGHWDESGTGYMTEGVTWSEVGNSGYYFLTGPDETYSTGDHYALLWSQGRVLIGDAGISITGDFEHEGPWQGIDTSPNGVGALKGSITAAANAARSGAARPSRPAICVRAPEIAACKR